MKIHFLGTNGWDDNAAGNTTCTLIDSKEGYIIFDAGDGIYKAERLLVENKPIYLFLSHLHLDHISGFHIFPVFTKDKEIHIILEKGNKELLENIVRHPYMNPLGNNIIYHEVEEGNHDEPLNFECRKIKHIDPSIGFRIILENKNISYCLDTGVCDNAVALAKDADLFITEASMIPGVSNPEWGHLNPEEAAKIAKDANARRMIMTHISADGYIDNDEKKEAEKKAKNIFENSVFAKDDLVIEL